MPSASLNLQLPPSSFFPPGPEPHSNLRTRHALEQRALMPPAIRFTLMAYPRRVMGVNCGSFGRAKAVYSVANSLTSMTWFVANG